MTAVTLLLMLENCRANARTLACPLKQEKLIDKSYKHTACVLEWNPLAPSIKKTNKKSVCLMCVHQNAVARYIHLKKKKTVAINNSTCFV